MIMKPRELKRRQITRNDEARDYQRARQLVEVHPYVPLCRHKPGRRAYADGHGRQLRIGVNQQLFSFTDADAPPERPCRIASFGQRKTTP